MMETSIEALKSGVIIGKGGDAIIKQLQEKSEVKKIEETSGDQWKLTEICQAVGVRVDSWEIKRPSIIEKVGKARMSGTILKAVVKVVFMTTILVLWGSHFKSRDNNNMF